MYYRVASKMKKLYIPEHSIELARELALEVELRDELASDENIRFTLDVMNGALVADPIRKGRQLISAGMVFEVPDHDADIEMLEESEVEEAKRENVAFAAKIDHYMWFGCMSFRGFGLRVWGLDYKTPKRVHAGTAFVPLDHLVAIFPSVY
jgi:hypothetical protein